MAVAGDLGPMTDWLAAPALAFEWLLCLASALTCGVLIARHRGRVHDGAAGSVRRSEA